MAHQIGQFLLFLGLIVLVIFWGTYQGAQPAYGLCLSGAAILLAGLSLLFRTRAAPPEESSRFRLWRRYRQQRTTKKKKK